MKYYFTILFISIFIDCTCQNIRNSNWLFSSDALIEPGVEGTIMSFSDDGILFDTFTMMNQISFCNTSISNKEGNLLFYSNGCSIFDSNYEIVEDGDNISQGGYGIDQDCPYWGNFSRRDNIILPINDSTYYLIHKRDTLVQFPLSIFNKELLYTEIIVKDSKVVVTSKNNIVENKIRFGLGYMHATQSADLNDWYIALVSTKGDTLYSYLIKDGNFELKDRFYFNGEIRSSAGQGFFSPDGKMFAAYCDETGLSVFDFDVSTGKYSNYRNVTVPDTFGFKGFCISSSSRFGYITTNAELYQVDFWEEDLEDGVMLIDTFDGFADPFPTRFAYGQLGPDCKLYISSTNGSKYMHVIHQPNLKGEACDFRQHDLEFPHYYYNPGSVPNLPFYRDDPDLDCRDVVDVVEEVPLETNKLSVYPNPTLGIIALDFDIPVPNNLAEVYDSKGILMLSKENARTLDLSRYSNGIYFIKVTTDAAIYTEKVLKID